MVVYMSKHKGRVSAVWFNLNKHARGYGSQEHIEVIKDAFLEVRVAKKHTDNKGLFKYGK